MNARYICVPKRAEELLVQCRVCGGVCECSDPQELGRKRMFISLHYKHARIHRDAVITFLSQMEMLILKHSIKGCCGLH